MDRARRQSFWSAISGCAFLSASALAALPLGGAEFPVEPVFETAVRPGADVDSVAVWRDSKRPERSLLFVTAKAHDRIEIYEAATGLPERRLLRGRLRHERPRLRLDGHRRGDGARDRRPRSTFLARRRTKSGGRPASALVRRRFVVGGPRRHRFLGHRPARRGDVCPAGTRRPGVAGAARGRALRGRAPSPRLRDAGATVSPSIRSRHAPASFAGRSRGVRGGAVLALRSRRGPRRPRVDRGRRDGRAAPPRLGRGRPGGLGRDLRSARRGLPGRSAGGVAQRR